jgi:hypothetical protein
MTTRIQVTAKFRNAVPHLIHEGTLYYSQKNRIYALSDLDNPRPKLVGAIPWRSSELLSHIRVADRVLKNGILQLHRNSRGAFLVTTGHKWWRVGTDGAAIQLHPPSMTRPMSRGICEAADGVTYIADYLDNPERAPVRIYRTSDFHSFQVCWEFPAGSIRHVHALVRDDEIENRIWILTGDEDQESAIWCTDNGFSSVDTFLHLGQMSRLVDLITTAGLLRWGTDSPDQLNHLMQCPKNDPSKVIKLQEVPGPVYYSCRNQAGALYFGTTVEPGAAVLDNFGHIIGSTPGGQWEEVYRAKKDRTSQHGIVQFPRGVLPGKHLVFSKRALKPDEGFMYISHDLAWSNRSMPAT